MILAWVVAAVVMVLFAPPLREAGTMEEANFLPKGTEPLHARELIGEYLPGAEAASSGTLVFHNPVGLSRGNGHSYRDRIPEKTETNHIT